MALCYYKLDFYDVSQEILDLYLKKYPDSMILTNLKACNLYKLYDGKAAEAELKNLVVSYSNIYKLVLYSANSGQYYNILCLLII